MKRSSLLGLAALLAVLAAGTGCSALRAPPKPKPELYKVGGKVLDADSKQGVPHANVLLKALMNTGLGTRTLSAYVQAGADGTFEIELSEGFDVVRRADRVILEVSAPGYRSQSVDLAVPTKKERVYKVPNLLLIQSTAPRGTETTPKKSSSQGGGGRPRAIGRGR